MRNFCFEFKTTYSFDRFTIFLFHFTPFLFYLISKAREIWSIPTIHRRTLNLPCRPFFPGCHGFVSGRRVFVIVALGIIAIGSIAKNHHDLVCDFDLTVVIVFKFRSGNSISGEDHIALDSPVFSKSQGKEIITNLI